MMTADVLILGGGAAGLIAGIAAAKAGRRTVIVEKQPRVGKRLLATGNGRCNLTNTLAKAEDYFGSPSFARSAMERFSPEVVCEYFRELGLECREEYGGRVFPRSNQAASVLDALRLGYEEAGGETVVEFEAVSVQPDKNGFRVQSKDGRSIRAGRVICAMGGMAAPNLGGDGGGLKLMRSLGHKVTTCVPALVQIKTQPESVRALKGIKIDGWARALVEGKEVAASEGEILFTDYGVSGPAVMQVSRPLSFALQEKKYAEIEVCAMDDAKHLWQRRERLSVRALEDFLTGIVPKRFGQVALKEAGAMPLSRTAGSLTDKELRALANVLTGWKLEVTGTNGYAGAQVMAGGVDTRDFDPDTMESKKVPHLYAAGEMLNVDGCCGGYNLQWAWASGLLAGSEAAKG